MPAGRRGSLRQCREHRRALGEYEAREQRKAAMRPANKAPLFDALAAAGTVTVTFDGTAAAARSRMSPRSAATRSPIFPRARSPRCRPNGTRRPCPARVNLAAAIEQLCHDLLQQSHPGWENNDGAFGEFVFDAAARMITPDHNKRYTATELSPAGSDGGPDGTSCHHALSSPRK